MNRIWALLVSMRTSAAIMVLLSSLMLLNVVVPQEEVLPEAYRRLVAQGPAARFLVEQVGLGNLPTSPIFHAALWLFFLNLGAVLLDRAGSTLRRLRAEPPTMAQLEAQMERAGVLPITRGPGWSAAAAARILKGLGYRAVPVGERALWAVKHPAALLGFPLFHLSFFILCAGGGQLYYSRQVATAVATEGQRIEGSDLHLVRRAPGGGVPPVALVLDRVDVQLERGQPMSLTAALRSAEPGAPPRTARVNHPAQWGALTVLVERAGLAPVLQLSDASGYTVDRVAMTLSAGEGTPEVALGDGKIRVAVEPVPLGPAFPEREALPRTRLRVRVTESGKTAFDGALPVGAPVAAGGFTVRIQEIRYWAFLRLVHERGGLLLVLGFAVLVTGIVWRMVWFRREVAVVWDETRVRLAGRGEFYPARFREELERMRALLAHPHDSEPGGRVG